MQIVEITIWSRTKGKGDRKVLHHATRELPDPEKLNRVVRQLLADADDAFVHPEKRPFKTMWRQQD